jgi:hypothetical protein
MLNFYLCSFLIAEFNKFEFIARSSQSLRFSIKISRNIKSTILFFMSLVARSDPEFVGSRAPILANP